MAKWYYIKKGEVYGPIGNRELKILLKEGFLLPEDKVRKKGTKRWAKTKRLIRIKKKKAVEAKLEFPEAAPSLEIISEPVEKPVEAAAVRPKVQIPEYNFEINSPQAFAAALLNGIHLPSNEVKKTVSPTLLPVRSKSKWVSKESLLACLAIIACLYWVPRIIWSGPELIKTSSIQGEVFFKGQKLPGGKVYFVHEKGLGASDIDESGKYKIMKVPVGNCKIMLQIPKQNEKGPSKATQELSFLKNPRLVTETKVKLPNIPERYFDVRTSGLSFSIKDDEKQIYQIQLEP